MIKLLPQSIYCDSLNAIRFDPTQETHSANKMTSKDLKSSSRNRRPQHPRAPSCWFLQHSPCWTSIWVTWLLPVDLRLYFWLGNQFPDRAKCSSGARNSALHVSHSMSLFQEQGRNKTKLNKIKTFSLFWYANVLCAFQTRVWERWFPPNTSAHRAFLYANAHSCLWNVPAQKIIIMKILVAVWFLYSLIT